MLNEKAYLLWSWPTLGTSVPRWVRSSSVGCPSPIPSLGFPLHQVYDKSRCPPVGVMETREVPWGLRCHQCKNKPVCRLSISHLSNNLRVLFQLPPNQFISLRAELWLKVEDMDAFLPPPPVVVSKVSRCAALSKCPGAVMYSSFMIMNWLWRMWLTVVRCAISRTFPVVVAAQRVLAALMDKVLVIPFTSNSNAVLPLTRECRTWCSRLTSLLPALVPRHLLYFWVSCTVSLAICRHGRPLLQNR